MIRVLNLHLGLLSRNDKDPGVLLDLLEDDPELGPDGHGVGVVGLVVGVGEPGQALSARRFLGGVLDDVLAHNLLVHLVGHDAAELELLRDESEVG